MCGFRLVSFLDFPMETQRGWFKGLIESSSMDIVIVPGSPTEHEICESVHGATCILTHFGIPFNRRVLESAKGTKLVQYGTVGYGSIDLIAATELGIPVANNPGWNAISVAEHTVMAMLVLLKKSFYIHEALSRGISVKQELRAPDNNQVWELYGKTVGILGLGDIGTQVAKRVKPFGAKIIYNKRNPLTSEEEEKLGVEYRTLTRLLEESDILTVHVPLTDETRGMVGKDQIAQMKKNSILINTARKDIVDEEALANAFREERLSGAGLDVPRDPEDMVLLHKRFEGVKNILYTPHMSGGTREAMIRAIKQPIANIVRVYNDEKPLYVVNQV